MSQTKRTFFGWLSSWYAGFMESGLCLCAPFRRLFYKSLSGWKLIVMQIVFVHWNVNVFSHKRYNWYLPNRKLYVLCCAKLLQSCLTLCNPTDCNPPGSSVHGIIQARILSGLLCPPPGDLPDPGIELTAPALAAGFFTTNATWEAQKVICQRLCFIPLTLLLWTVIPTFLNVCMSTYINIYIKFSFCCSNYSFHLL